MSDGENTPRKLPWLKEPWKPGQSGNPTGRPRGSRNKLGTAFIEALHDDFHEHGVAVIEEVRKERPHEYLKVVASLLPKELHVKDVSIDDLTDDELGDILTGIRSLIAGGGEAKARKRARAPVGDKPPGEQLN